MKIVERCSEKKVTFSGTKPGDVFKCGGYVYWRVADPAGYASGTKHPAVVVARRIGSKECVPEPHELVSFDNYESDIITLLPNAVLVLNPKVE